MNLIVLPAFTDPPLWMLHDGAIISTLDPGDSVLAHAALAVQRRQPCGILVMPR
jgi:hypothetical protein